MRVPDLATRAVAERVQTGATSRTKALALSLVAGVAATVVSYRLLRPRGGGDDGEPDT